MVRNRLDYPEIYVRSAWQPKITGFIWRTMCTHSRVRLARTEDSLGEAKTRVAVLTGNLKWRSQTAYLFIKGAIMAEEMEAAPDHVDFSENQWKQIQEAQKEYFEDQEIRGMVLFAASASPESIGSDVQSTHETFWRRKSPDAYGTSGKGRCFLPL